jgi:hypothetical protein
MGTKKNGRHPKARATSFKPGQSGNPKGRPKGALNRRPKSVLDLLAHDFLVAVKDDFNTNGRAVVAKMRKDNPGEYLRVLALIAGNKERGPG